MIKKQVLDKLAKEYGQRDWEEVMSWEKDYNKEFGTDWIIRAVEIALEPEAKP